VADFNDQLNSILSNPDAMSQIMQLAQSISGEQEQASTPQRPPAEPPPTSPFDGFDPALLAKVLPLARELGTQTDSNARQLLYALRPYLKTERQEKVERALQLARLFHLGKTFLAEWEG